MIPVVVSILVALSVLLFSGFLLTSVGFDAGILGLISILRDRQRSWFVWLSGFVLVYVSFWIGGELLYPH